MLKVLPNSRSVIEVAVFGKDESSAPDSLIYSQNKIAGFSVAIVNENGPLYVNGFGYADKKANSITKHERKKLLLTICIL